MLRDHSNKWKQKHTSFWWKPLRTNHKMSHSFTLIIFLRENELFQRGWGIFVTLVEIPEGWGGPSVPCKNGKSRGVGVWILSGTTHFIIVVCAQENGCQCYVLLIIICKLGESVHWQGRDIKARKGEVRVGGTEEVRGAANIICHPPYDFRDKGDDMLTTY